MFYTQPGMAGLCWDHWHRRACRRWSAPKLPVPWCHTATPGRPGTPKVSLCEQVVNTTWAQPSTRLPHCAMPGGPGECPASCRWCSRGTLTGMLWNLLLSCLSESRCFKKHETNIDKHRFCKSDFSIFFGVMEMSWKVMVLIQSSDVFGLFRSWVWVRSGDQRWNLSSNSLVKPSRPGPSARVSKLVWVKPTKT